MPKEELLKIYKCMITLNTMDQIFYDAQRQGRISFYMTSYGEEGSVVASAAALDPDDLMYGQYREQGALMYRGFTLQEFANQLFSNVSDYGKGRQMPVHYGSVKYNFHTISSPLATQIPQAAGAAYAYKREGRQNAVLCYFGEGAASEGDFHAALNAASTRGGPCIFYCRNNGYAISTGVEDQYAGDGIASRAIGYGMRHIRVDGNDVLAVYSAVKEARRVAIEESVPVFVEAMSYRGGHHSTSDDSTRYRDVAEIRSWSERNNPMNRLRLFLEDKGWWDSQQEADLMSQCRNDVMEAFNNAEHAPKPSIHELFTDVYDKKTTALEEQERDLHVHIEKHAEYYEQALSHHSPDKPE
jgi:2-oxoisovalerate dehydrogenase E1 component subunit alpha